MKSFVIFIGIVEIVACIVFLIIWFVNKFESLYLVNAITCFINGLVFLYIAGLGNRVEDVEDILAKKGISKPINTRTAIIVNDIVSLKKDCEVNGSKIAAGEKGVVVGIEANVYYVEFDNNKGKKVPLNVDYLEKE